MVTTVACNCNYWKVTQLCLKFLVPTRQTTSGTKYKWFKEPQLFNIYSAEQTNHKPRAISTWSFTDVPPGLRTETQHSISSIHRSRNVAFSARYPDVDQHLTMCTVFSMEKMSIYCLNTIAYYCPLAPSVSRLHSWHNTKALCRALLAR